MNEAIEILVRHGYWVLFVLMLLKQFGAPLPGTPVQLAAGALVGAG